MKNISIAELDKIKRNLKEDESMTLDTLDELSNGRGDDEDE